MSLLVQTLVTATVEAFVLIPVWLTAGLPEQTKQLNSEDNDHKNCKQGDCEVDDERHRMGILRS